MVVHGSVSKEVQHYILELLVCGKEFSRKDIVEHIKQRMSRKSSPSVLTYCLGELKQQGIIRSVSKGIYAYNTDYVPEEKKSIRTECTDILEKAKDDLTRLARSVSPLNTTLAEKKALEGIRKAIVELETMKKLFR